MGQSSVLIRATLNLFFLNQRLCINLPINNYSGTKPFSCCVSASCGAGCCEVELILKIISLVCRSTVIYVFEETRSDIWLWFFKNLPVHCGDSGTSSFFLCWLSHHTFRLVISQIFSIFLQIGYLKIERGLFSQCLINDSIIRTACLSTLPLAVVVCNWLQKRQIYILSHCIFVALKSTAFLNMHRISFALFLLFLFFLELLLAQHVTKVARDS